LDGLFAVLPIGRWAAPGKRRILRIWRKAICLLASSVDTVTDFIAVIDVSKGDWN
jgi:hypothetical protein